MRYPEHLIEQIRAQSDIIEVISETVQLRKSGRGFIGLCPFHPDKKPSMNVNPDLGIFKCFSCGKGGNVITFLMDKQGLTFTEAIKSLAYKASIPLPDDQEVTNQSNEVYNRREAAFKVLAAAGKYYQNTLHSPIGETIIRYFLGRGFDISIQELFGLGYAPDSWSDTLLEMQKLGFSEQALEDAGLILRREKDGKPYDRFRGRAIFPIHDPLGKIIGFGARRMNDDDNQPKYINSPQSLVYDKSRVLYGLAQAKSAIRSEGKAILTEGYADTIALVQAGFTNVIASSGTALTIEQLQLLSRYCKKLYIVYDGDSAGIQAALRGMELAVETGLDVWMVTLPEGEDPDSFIKMRGPDDFRRALRDAKSFLQYKSDALKKQGLFDTASGKAQAIRSLVETIAKVPDTLQHDFLIQQLADSMQLSYSQLEKVYEELRKAKFSLSKNDQQKNIYPDQILAQEHTEKDIISAQETSSSYTQVFPEEKEILRIALTSDNALRYMTEVLGISKEAFLSPSASRLYQYTLDIYIDKGDTILIQHLTDRNDLPEDVRNLIMDIVFLKEDISANWTKFKVEIPQENVRRALMESLAKLRLRHLEIELDFLRAELKQNPHNEKEQQIMMRLQEILQERHEIPMKFHTSLI